MYFLFRLDLSLHADGGKKIWNLEFGIQTRAKLASTSIRRHFGTEFQPLAFPKTTWARKRARSQERERIASFTFVGPTACWSAGELMGFPTRPVNRCWHRLLGNRSSVFLRTQFLWRQLGPVYIFTRKSINGKETSHRIFWHMHEVLNEIYL